ncbi:hypothetical protein RND71_001974 [Anisodus tanguticus]|uniref:Glucan endo-1,3-beta-D-glucosidase n=1 Tax=Anisodus tanguticus TaxID=243964 RepID=A0AAE1T1T7_9SOLA|nr:hypothetical protein RND71_001974 [Anisodus tanguticus]
MLGNNLPSHDEVIQLCKSRNITILRLYDPNHGALQDLRGSNIEVMLGLPNSDVKHIASGMEHAKWNEISPVIGTSYLTSHLGSAMNNIYNAINFAGLGYDIKVSTSVDMTLIGNSYPPSQGSFRSDVRRFVDPIAPNSYSKLELIYCSILPSSTNEGDLYEKIQENKANRCVAAATAFLIWDQHSRQWRTERIHSWICTVEMNRTNTTFPDKTDLTKGQEASILTIRHHEPYEEDMHKFTSMA